MGKRLWALLDSTRLGGAQLRLGVMPLLAYALEGCPGRTAERVLALGVKGGAQGVFVQAPEPEHVGVTQRVVQLVLVCSCFS